MKKAVLSLMFVALSVMAFAQQWTGISKESPAGPTVKLISSSESKVVIDFSLGGFYMTEVSTPNGEQTVVSVPKMATMLEKGCPDLPYYPVSAIIGDRAEMKVTVSKSTFTDYENVEIAPSKGNISRQIDPATVPYTYGEMYNMNAFYPANQASLDAPYILRDYRGQNIIVSPFAYNPATKTLRVYHEMTVEMYKVSDNGENPKVEAKGAVKVDPEMQQTYKRQFINFSESSSKYNFITDRGEMLVICADQFMAGMEEFVAWKNQSGRPTTMVSVSEVGGNNDNTIKSYITDLYNNPDHNLQFVLFVGDYEHITPHALGGERSDNWFGQIVGNDRYDDVIIGRFSVQTDAHVANQANKVIYYERDLGQTVRDEITWVNKGLGIGAIGAGSGHYGEDDYQHIDLIRDTLEHYTYEHVTELHGGGGATASSISAAINEGVSIINYCNHGSPTSWGVANYSVSHVNALVNDYKWPINWSVACQTGQFNYGGANSECFAEAWMRASNNTTGVPTGAIGGMFSWMSQPWIPPMYGQDEMVAVLCEWRDADKFNHTMGGASINGNMNVLDMSGSQGNDTHDTWIFFGDPTLMVRTDNPTSMEISLSPSVLMLGMNTLEVSTVDTPFGIATLMMDGEVIASSYIVDNVANLEFAPVSNVGMATLTVMGYNKVTEIISVEVLPAEGPYVTVENYAPNFAPVNQATDLSISFKNVGVDPTNGNTNVVLSCEDERLTIINGTAQFGPLPANETVMLSNAFSFIVAEGVEDGERFQIDIDMTDGRQSWRGKATITAGQAILNYTGTSWAGSFVPGETVALVANFQNIGHYMAMNSVASISCDNPYVTIVNPTVELGTIAPNGIGSAVFEIVIDAACPETEQITVNFRMDADGDLSAEGSTILKNSCNVIFNLLDSYGDGWNGNVLNVSFSDGTPAQHLTINSGSTASYTIEIGNGVEVTLTWSSGQYISECSFVVNYEGGEVIYNCPNPSAALNYQFICSCGSSAPIGNFNPVENLTATAQTESVVLTWDAPEGAIRYTVTRNGVLVGETDETTFVDELLQEDTYTYCVVAVYEDGASIPTCEIITAEWGIEEANDMFSIYPNPVSNTLYINGGNAEFSYEMFNGMGQMVTNGNAQGTVEINVNGMTQGIYFLHLTSGTQVRVEKVVVK